MLKHCAICGREFHAPPSAKIYTCSRKCSSILRSTSHIGKSNAWGAEGRIKAAASARQTGNCQLGTPAATSAYYAAPERYHAAKNWIVISPDGEILRVRNLSITLRRRLGAGDGRKVYKGLIAVKRSMEGKLRRSVSQSHGWTLHPNMFKGSPEE